MFFPVARFFCVLSKVSNILEQQCRSWGLFSMRFTGDYSNFGKFLHTISFKKKFKCLRKISSTYVTDTFA